MTDADVILAKVATMERCRARITEIRSPARQPHLLPVDVEDLLAVNLQRAAYSFDQMSILKSAIFLSSVGRLMPRMRAA
jgi:hypothetical protein